MIYYQLEVRSPVSRRGCREYWCDCIVDALSNMSEALSSRRMCTCWGLRMHCVRVRRLCRGYGCTVESARNMGFYITDCPISLEKWNWKHTFSWEITYWFGLNRLDVWINAYLQRCNASSSKLTLRWFALFFFNAFFPLKRGRTLTILRGSLL